MFQFPSDYSKWAKSAPNSIVPPRVSYIPAGPGVVTGLGAGEAFGMAVLANGDAMAWGAGQVGACSLTARTRAPPPSWACVYVLARDCGVLVSE